MSYEEYFDSLYREMYFMMLCYAEKSLDNQHALAEEAVQSAFCVLWINIEVVMKKENPRGWLLDTLKNVIRNIRRSQARYANLFLALSSAMPCREPSALDETRLDTLYGDLQGNPDYELLKEFVLEHKTIKEIAQANRITIAACKKRLQRAKEKLRKFFEKN